MFSIGRVLTRDNNEGEYSTEPERTARYRDLLMTKLDNNNAAPIGIYLGACRTSEREKEKDRRGTSTSHGNSCGI